MNNIEFDDGMESLIKLWTRQYEAKLPRQPIINYFETILRNHMNINYISYFRVNNFRLVDIVDDSDVIELDLRCGIAEVKQFKFTIGKIREIIKYASE